MHLPYQSSFHFLSFVPSHSETTLALHRFPPLRRIYNGYTFATDYSFRITLSILMVTDVQNLLPSTSAKKEQKANGWRGVENKLARKRLRISPT